MSRRATLPLGVDVGAARTRVAQAELDARGRPVLVAVASRATGDDAAAALAGARAELRTRERRCVLAIAPPDAAVRSVVLPAMGTRERTRAARFEALRFVDMPPADAAVRVVRERGDGCIVGVARRTVLDRLVAVARRAGLRPLAVDDAALALLRAYPDAGAIVDVGTRATLLVVPREPVPLARVVGDGGDALSSALAASLGIDAAAAEARKRSIGMGGAAEHASAAMIDAIASALVAHRAATATDVRSVVLTGNGARLAGFAAALERAIAIPVAAGVLDGAAATAYPPDVVRAASPDWALAVGLALWAA